MQFTPEAQILILNATILGVAYLGIYPSLQNKTLRNMGLIETILGAIALIVAGALFWGTNAQFSLILFNTNWAIFTLITFSVMELPLFLRFAKKHGISFD